MTMLNLETVVQTGVRVVTDSANVMVRMGSNQANLGAEAVVLSLKRHLSSKPAPSEADRGPRYTAILGGATAPRAGRLADFDGDPKSRHPLMQRWFSPVRTASRRICSPGLTRLTPLAKQLPTGARPTGRGVTTLRGR
jgi:hypothetical protein